MSSCRLIVDRLARLQRCGTEWREPGRAPCKTWSIRSHGVAVASIAARLSIAAAFVTEVASAAPQAANAEGAALTVGPGDAALAPSFMPRFEGEPVALVPTPPITVNATRAEPAYNFRGVPTNEVQGMSFRWWLGGGRSAVGFGFGTIGYALPSGAAGSTAGTLVGAVPVASVGLRYALTPTTFAYADGSGARGLAGERDMFYNAKAGVEWKPATSRLGFEGGRLGLQLDSGYRVSLRTRKGGLTIYLRRTF
jgi:hypothetical protein